MDTRWLSSWVPRPHATVQLFCFPRAGASGSIYRRWSNHFSDFVELCPVELPGRWGRSREPPFERFESLLDAIFDALAPFSTRRIALLGYSFGGLVAFELARRIRQRERVEISDLFILARGAPHDTPPLPHGLDLDAPNDRFISKMVECYGPFPGDAHLEPDLLEVVLPPLRADIRALGSYRYVPEEPLRCAIHALGGEEDPIATEAGLRGWRQHTLGAFDCHLLPGGHYFGDTEPDRVASYVRRMLEMPR